MWKTTPARMRYFEHGMLGVLLASALASAPAAELLGWADEVFSSPPRGLHLAMLAFASGAMALLPVRQRENSARGALVRLGVVAVVAIPLAAVLRRSSNPFYTTPSLMTGMVALLVLHLTSRLMRRITVDHRETFLMVPGSVGRQGSRAVTLPAVALADALASVAAWTLLSFWLLVALERRHLASVVLVFTSALLVLECAIQFPDTLAACGLLPRGLHRVDDMRDPDRSVDAPL